MKTEPSILEILVPTVEEGPGLIHVFDFEPGRTEVLHRGAWLLVDAIQKAAPHPATGEARVYLQLEGELEAYSIPSIDLATGIIEHLHFTRHLGPVLLSPVSTLRKARHRSILEEGLES